MTIKRILPWAAGLAALFALAFLLFRAPGRAPNTVVLDGRAGAVAAAEEATLRNVTKKPVLYTIEPSPYVRQPRARTLAVGGVDRIATAMPVEITYNNGARKDSYTVFPGRPYSFRYDEYGLIKVYPGSHGRADAADLAPFVPTPMRVVRRMLEMAGVGRDDVVYDLGCGDGRMVITAAKTFLARGVGIDIDPKLIRECRAAAKREGVDGITRFLCMDATKAHITEATVLALYLLPESLETLRPLFERELRPGSRVVSHNYRVPGWDGRLAAADVLADEDGRPHKIFLYKMLEGR